MDEFLAWEERQETKHEFDGVHVIAMVGGTSAHALISGNVLFALLTRLRGKPCRAYNADFMVEVAGSLRYPDVSVVCGPVAPRARRTDRPVVLFEVLSQSTAATDLSDKQDEYRNTPSVQRYVVLWQDRMHALVFTRTGADWVRAVVDGDLRLEMPEIGVSVQMAEFYIDVTFEAEEDAP